MDQVDCDSLYSGYGPNYKFLSITKCTSVSQHVSWYTCINVPIHTARRILRLLHEKGFHWSCSDWLSLAGPLSRRTFKIQSVIEEGCEKSQLSWESLWTIYLSIHRYMTQCMDVLDYRWVGGTVLTLSQSNAVFDGTRTNSFSMILGYQSVSIMTSEAIFTIGRKISKENLYWKHKIWKVLNL